LKERKNIFRDQRKRPTYSSRCGTYVLVFYLASKQTLGIGKLGEFQFKPGYYAYIGSAFGPGGLNARLQHHLGSSHRAHWHIDYLKRFATLDEIWYAEQTVRRECQWAALFSSMPKVAPAIKGFGASDCQCYTHLFFSEYFPQFTVFSQMLESTFPQDGGLQRCS